MEMIGGIFILIMLGFSFSFFGWLIYNIWQFLTWPFHSVWNERYQEKHNTQDELWGFIPISDLYSD